MILSFFTQKSTRSAKLSSVFAERFSGEGQADFAINKAHKVSLKGRNNLYISCVLMLLSTIKNATDIQVISTFQGHLVRFVYSEVSLPLARESFSEN